MRRLWLITALIFLVGCGQPLQLGSAAPGTLPSGPRPLVTAAPAPPTSVSATSEVTATATAAEAAPVLTATPEPATSAPEATAPAVVITPQAAPAQSTEERWRAQQIERKVFDERRIYVARSPVSLWWYDPGTGQSLEIGTLIGQFVAQAEFTFRPSGAAAYEVPYRINNDFGLTAISPAIRDRMAMAGLTESVEAYVLQSDAIQPLGE